MKNMLRVSTLVIAAVALIGCQTSAKQSEAPALSNAELTKLYLATQTVSWTNLENTASGTATYGPAGRATTDWGGGSSKGTWRIVGNTVCTTWAAGSFRGAGVEECVTYHKTGEGKYNLVLPNGSVKYTNVFK